MEKDGWSLNDKGCWVLDSEARAKVQADVFNYIESNRQEKVRRPLTGRYADYLEDMPEEKGIDFDKFIVIHHQPDPEKPNRERLSLEVKNGEAE